MTNILELVSDLMETMGIDADRRDDVTDAVRAHVEGTYEDSTLRAAKHDETGELAARRERLCRAVWRDLGLGPYPW